MSLKTETVTLDREDGRDFTAYLARPDGNGPYPIMLVIIEAFGVNDHMRKVTEQYANEGYAAICPDLYFRNEGSRVAAYTDIPAAVAMMQKLTDATMTADLSKAIDYLKQQPYANPSKIGTVGYCWERDKQQGRQK